MKYRTYREFEISKRRPKVLLLGNGVLLSCKLEQGEQENRLYKWKESIYKIAKKEYDEESKKALDEIPYSVLATTVADVRDKERREKYINHFNTAKFEESDILRDLLSVDFDAILTTNYTYEIEDVFNSQFSALKNKLDYVYTTKPQPKKVKKETKVDPEKKDVRLLHTYNIVKGSPPIWHIHGELRTKRSMVLTHDEYSRLICDIVNYNCELGNIYENCQKKLKFKSWIDYFVMGDVFVVGQGLDFSEFDLWWIINRKKREKASCGAGRLYYFTPKNKSEKVQSVLNEMGFNVETFGLEICEDRKDEDYKNFYRMVIKKLQGNF